MVNCSENCPPAANTSDESQNNDPENNEVKQKESNYAFQLTEDLFDASMVQKVQTNEFAAAILLSNGTIVSHYLESSPRHVANQVQLDFKLHENFKIVDFYFDQVLLVVMLEKASDGLRQLEIFNYAQGKYLHLDVVKASHYKDSRLVVDDRRSINKIYRVLQFGYPVEDPNVLHIQVISFDFSLGNFDEGNTPLVSQECITDVKMSGDLVVILCAENHEITFMMIDEKGTIKISPKDIFKGDITEDAQIEYGELVLIRHSSSAYQVHL